MQTIAKANTHFSQMAEVHNALHKMYTDKAKEGYTHVLEAYMPNIKYFRHHWYKDETTAQEVAKKMQSKEVKVLGVFTIQTAIDNIYS